MKNFSKIILTVLMFWQSFSYACDACKAQQPKITQNLTHGEGPTSNWDYVIVGIIALITLATLVFSVKYLVKPGERNKTHIKNSVLDF